MSQPTKEEWTQALEIIESLDPSYRYTEPVPRHAHLMEIAEWRDAVRAHAFIDYDGFGYAIKAGRMTKKAFYPSEAHLVPDDATHIMWCNR